MSDPVPLHESVVWVRDNDAKTVVAALRLAAHHVDGWPRGPVKVKLHKTTEGFDLKISTVATT